LFGSAESDNVSSSVSEENIVSATVRIAPLVVAFALTAARLFAADGLLIVQKHTSGGTTNINQVQIEKTRMRAETGGGDRAQVVVFDSTAQVVRMINPTRKTYTELTKADVDRLGTQMAGARSQMQDQMKNLPPEQRERLEAMMKGRGMAAPGAAMAKTEYRKVGTDRVGKWTCDKYDGYRGDQKVSEICTVNPSVLGVTAADFDIAKEAVKFFGQLAPQNTEQMFSFGGADQGFSGIPVRSVVSVGPTQITTEVTDVTRKAFSDDGYAVPAGFTKQDMPGAGGRRGRQQ
jgi:hypothetical protein